MTDYRIPIHYDPSHYKDKLTEGKDVGAWMISTLEEVLSSYGVQAGDPGNFTDLTDQQGDQSETIFVGQMASAGGAGTQTVSIKEGTPRELIVSFDGQAAENASNDDIIESLYKSLEKAYFTRSGETFEKTESVSKTTPAGGETAADAAGSADGGAQKSGGCYIATAVYGSYDCPEVWTLRRFRDEKLLQSAPGRLFVKAYYATSPAVIRLCGGTEWFQRFWRNRLNRMVDRLRAEGYKDTPYRDK